MRASLVKTIIYTSYIQLGWLAGFGVCGQALDICKSGGGGRGGMFYVS